MSGVCRGILSLIGLFSHELVTNVIVVMLPKSSVKDAKAFYSLVNRMVYTGGNFTRSISLWFLWQICGTLIWHQWHIGFILVRDSVSLTELGKDGARMAR